MKRKDWVGEKHPRKCKCGGLIHFDRIVDPTIKDEEIIDLTGAWLCDKCGELEFAGVLILLDLDEDDPFEEKNEKREEEHTVRW